MLEEYRGPTWPFASSMSYVNQSIISHDDLGDPGDCGCLVTLLTLVTLVTLMTWRAGDLILVTPVSLVTIVPCALTGPAMSDECWGAKPFGVPHSKSPNTLCKPLNHKSW